MEKESQPHVTNPATPVQSNNAIPEPNPTYNKELLQVLLKHHLLTEEMINAGVIGDGSCLR